MTTPRSPAHIPRITVEELKSLLVSGQAVEVLDVRSPREYDWMHIAGALPADPERLEKLKLTTGAKIVTY